MAFLFQEASPQTLFSSGLGHSKELTPSAVREQQIGMHMTTRDVGFIASLTHSRALEVAPAFSLDQDEWKAIRAAYIAFSAKLSFVHEQANIPMGAESFARVRPYDKHISREVQRSLTMSSLKLLLDQVGLLKVEKKTFIPILLLRAHKCHH